MKADPASSVRTHLTDEQAPVPSATRPSRACWLVFASAIAVSIFIHELGHCTVPWLHGYPAIPTPAKEYILKPLTEGIQNQMALSRLRVLSSPASESGRWPRTLLTGRLRLRAISLIDGWVVERLGLVASDRRKEKTTRAQRSTGFSEISEPRRALVNILSG